MNPELHHKWNSARDPFYGDHVKETQGDKPDPKMNKVLLKQNGVRTPR